MEQISPNQYYEQQQQQEDDDIDNLVNQLYNTNIDTIPFNEVVNNYILLYSEFTPVETIKNIQLTHSRWIRIFSSWDIQDINLYILTLLTESVKYDHNPPHYDAREAIGNALRAIIIMNEMDPDDISSLNEYLSNCE